MYKCVGASEAVYGMEYIVWYKHLHVDLIILVLNNTMQTLHLKAKLAVLCGWHANWG